MSDTLQNLDFGVKDSQVNKSSRQLFSDLIKDKSRFLPYNYLWIKIQKGKPI